MTVRKDPSKQQGRQTARRTLGKGRQQAAANNAGARLRPARTAETTFDKVRRGGGPKRR